MYDNNIIIMLGICLAWVFYVRGVMFYHS